MLLPLSISTMIFITRHLRWILLPILISGAFAQRESRKPSTPLEAEIHTVQRSTIQRTVPTVGTLRANESVTLVSELSRRLAKIHFAEGAEVAAGELLFKLDDHDLVAELGEIKARLNLAVINKNRAENLLPNRAISQQEYDTVTGELLVLEARKVTQETLLAKTEIRAPFAGRIGVRQVSEGAFVSPSTPLATLQDVSRIKVDFPLPERYSSEVKVGQNFTFTVAGSGEIFQGTVAVIDPAIDAATRSLLVRGLCTSPKGLLPGGFAEVKLTLDGMANGFMLPGQAIVPSPRGQGVYLIKEGRAKLQPVEIGIRTEDEVQILRGLQEGDQVAVTGLMRIRPGIEVKPATP